MYAVPGALIGIAAVYLEGIRRERARQDRRLARSPSRAVASASALRFRLALAVVWPGAERPALRSPSAPSAEVGRLERELGVSGPVAQVLVRRGLGEPAGARAFLAAEEEHPPDGVRRHRRGGRVDPRAREERRADHDPRRLRRRRVCSTAVLVRALRGMGANVDWYLPDRASDGYGLNEDTVRRLAARGTRLLVTVDCAITAVEEVAAARALGMEVVVTDHHAPRADGVLPRGADRASRCSADTPARSCARRRSPTSWRRRCRSGRRPETRELEEDLDLVALATIADVVPLVGENRTLVRRGLRALASTTQARAARADGGGKGGPGKVNERSVGFALAPRLNAAGRMYRADAGLELILTEDPERAAQIAEELDRANRERRQVETRIRFAGRSADRRAERARLLRAGGGGLAPRGDRHRRLAPGRAPPSPRRDDLAGGRDGEGVGAQHRGVRPARG